jgi:hypothetical protein
MNNDNRIFELNKEIYGILYKNRFIVTIELLDETKVSGRIIKHNTSSSPLK